MELTALEIQTIKEVRDHYDEAVKSGDVNDMERIGKQYHELLDQRSEKLGLKKIKLKSSEEIIKEIISPKKLKQINVDNNPGIDILPKYKMFFPGWRSMKKKN